MDVENSAYEQNSDYAGKFKENSDPGDGNHVNGMSNGYSSKPKSHHSDKDRDKHRDKDKDRSKSKEHKSSSKDKERHSSSSKDKERHSSSHKSSSKDKERDKDRSERDKERSDKGEKDKHRDRDKDRDKHKDEKKSSSSKEHKSSSKDKDREHKDREKSSSSKDKDKEKDKHKDKEKHSSSSSSKDKDRDRDRDKHKEKHRDKDKEKDKDKHHSSSKDKSRKDKERERDRDKHKSEKAEKAERESNDVAPKRKPIIEDDSEDDDFKNNVVQEPEIKQEIKVERNSEQYDEDINVSAASSCDYNLSAFKDEPSFKEESEEAEQAESDEDISLAQRLEQKRKKEPIEEDDDDDNVPLSARKKPKKEQKQKKTKGKKRAASSDEDEKPIKKSKKPKVKAEPPSSTTTSPKKKKKQEEEQEVWKWWEEEKKEDGQKWNFLEHKGPVFAPPYEKLPSNVKFYYNGKEMQLSEEAEEVAGFYAKMLDHDYTSKEVFNNNFFKDWRKVMTDEERSTITDLRKCNFKKMHAYFMDVAEKNRNRSKEEKKELKEKNEEILKEYGFCTIDGHKEKIGNFKIEPPGLFRGRGEHPKMGMLKKRVMPEDVLINCSKASEIPKPPKGHKWKEVRHDPSVTWLASWTENVQNQVKYVMLNPSSKLKGEKDWQKYETARRLAASIDKIRKEYREDWKSKEMRIRQRAVALYFIDRLALRAGNEKDEDQADTVGCCSLRVEHLTLHEEKDDKEFVVVFDFLGKDSIRYYNEVPVEKRVFKNLQLFMENKQPGDDLFDRLNTAIMNKHLNELMEGLTAKVFRTYNASYTLQQQLDELTNANDSISEKILSYNRANRAVAILCNHQRSVPKGHQKSMEKLKEKIEAKKDQIKEMQQQVKEAKHSGGGVYEKKKKALDRLKEQLVKLEIQETDKDENKAIALGTSKLNYLDPRISVAWCKKYEVPIEKIYNKTQRDKFRWAIDMAGPDYRF